MPLYDEDGNVVPGTEKLSAEELKTTLEELTTIKDELVKLRAKDLNFEKLRKFRLISELSEEEKAKLSAKELELMQRQEELEKKTGEFESKMHQTWKDGAFKKIVGTDPELIKKVDLQFNETLKGVEAKSEEEYINKVSNAYLLATGQKPSYVSSGAEFSSAGAKGIEGADKKPTTKEEQEFEKKLGIKSDAEVAAEKKTAEEAAKGTPANKAEENKH